jgi:hypothetical protein
MRPTALCPLSTHCGHLEFFSSTIFIQAIDPFGLLTALGVTGRGHLKECRVTQKRRKFRQSVMRPAAPASAEEFAANLQRRRQAAQGLEQDLLTKVPLLYGSPDNLAPHGDPGVVLAQIHQDELLRKNGGGVLSRSRKRSEVALPFERTTAALAILLFLFFLFVD